MSVQGPDSSSPSSWSSRLSDRVQAFSPLQSFVKAFGRGITKTYTVSKGSIPKEDEHSSRPKTRLKRRHAIIRKAKAHVQRHESPAKQQLRHEILSLSKSNPAEFDRWAEKLKGNLATVAEELKKEGVEVTIDLKLDRLFQGYEFNADDLDLLTHLRDLGLRKNVVAHLAGKIALDIVEDVGYHSRSTADRLSNRGLSYKNEAAAARKQFLMEEDLKGMSAGEIKSTLKQLAGRPYGLRMDLQYLDQKLSSLKWKLSSDREAIASIREDIDEFMSGPHTRDLTKVSRFVIDIKTRMQDIPACQKSKSLSQWPMLYPPEVEAKLRARKA